MAHASFHGRSQFWWEISGRVPGGNTPFDDTLQYVCLYMAQIRRARARRWTGHSDGPHLDAWGSYRSDALINGVCSSEGS